MWNKNIAVNIDGGKWYEKKLEFLKNLDTGGSQNQQPSDIPVSGWDTFPSNNIPNHSNMGHIHHHIVESVQLLGTTSDENDDEDIDDLHTAKPLKRGKLYFKSGYVQQMRDCKTNGHYFVKEKNTVAVVFGKFQRNSELSKQRG